MTAPVKVRVSEEEYLATMTDEKPSLEFVNGEVFQKPITKKSHNEVAMVLFEALRTFRRTHGGYATWEATTNLSEASHRRYRVPDLAFWAADRGVSQPNDVFLPPTIAIEIRSEGQSMGSLRDKCRGYLSRGIPVCWLIDPFARTVEVFEGPGVPQQILSDGELTSPELPGFALPIAELWAEL
jgi:Uma2 family endonuclease